MSAFTMNAKFLENSAALRKQYCMQNTPLFGTVITVIEARGAKWVMLPTMVVFKGTAYYKGWYSEAMDEKPAHFADSSNLLHNG